MHNGYMKFGILTILLLCLSPMTYAKSACNTHQIKIAVIDSGLDLDDYRFKDHLCPTGHKDFTGEGLLDKNSHGTHIAGLIQLYAKNANYCLLIYKYYSSSVPGIVNLQHEVAAMEKAIKDGADIVNFSGGGAEFNEEEARTINYNPKVIFVVAAGNKSEDLDISGNEYYPASLFYSNMKVVGSIDKKGNRSWYSNYSKNIKDKELGENVVSYIPGNKVGTLSGTSQATAIVTGKLVDKLSNSCQYRWNDGNSNRL